MIPIAGEFLVAGVLVVVLAFLVGYDLGRGAVSRMDGYQPTGPDRGGRRPPRGGSAVVPLRLCAWDTTDQAGDPTSHYCILHGAHVLYCPERGRA